MWHDREGLAWIDPTRRDAWSFVLDVAEEAAHLGFDEVQFDYVRFPDAKGLRFSVPDNEAMRVATIGAFLDAARQRLAPHNVFVAADVFGYVFWNRDDTGIGQQLESIAERVAGPMLDAQRLSFTGFAPMPVQHGMTMGEMARFLQARLRDEGIEVDLQVVPMQGYRRAMRFAQTGLDWVPPSPNLRRPSTALLYAGSSWVEGTNVSVGRGTGHPFEWVGAPWIEGGQLAAALQAQRLPGAEVQPVVFVPGAAPFRGRRCEGVALRVTDAAAFDGPRLGAALLQALHQLWPATFRMEGTVGMVGSSAALEAMAAGLSLDARAAQWTGDSAGFLRQREVALLYGD